METTAHADSHCSHSHLTCASWRDGAALDFSTTERTPSRRLAVNQLLEWAGLGDQLTILAGLDDFPLLDDVDAVGVHDGGQAVGDHQAGDAFQLASDAVGDN